MQGRIIYEIERSPRPEEPRQAPLHKRQTTTMMMRAALLLALAAVASAAGPIVLDETNFEHLTQASTGES